MLCVIQKQIADFSPADIRRQLHVLVRRTTFPVDGSEGFIRVIINSDDFTWHGKLLDLLRQTIDQRSNIEIIDRDAN